MTVDPSCPYRRNRIDDRLVQARTIDQGLVIVLLSHADEITYDFEREAAFEQFKIHSIVNRGMISAFAHAQMKLIGQP